jgi:hypothetical protein
MLSFPCAPEETVKAEAKDALEDGTVSFRTLLTVGILGWEIVSSESLFVKRKLKSKIQKSIEETAKAIIAAIESDDEDGSSASEQVDMTQPSQQPSTNQGDVRKFPPRKEIAEVRTALRTRWACVNQKRMRQKPIIPLGDLPFVTRTRLAAGQL